MSYKKITVKTGPDIALIKYWGKKDEKLRLPENGSISMKLEGIGTVTTVEFNQALSTDDVLIDGKNDQKEVSRVIKHLDRIRSQFGKEVYAKVVSINNFPKGTGLSSSGSAFAALTLAAVQSLGLEMDEKELSILSRQGSGTACRCVCGGFVEWINGNTSETSYSQTIVPQSYWDVRDVIAIVNDSHKKVSSTEGHQSASTSPFYKVRQDLIEEKIDRMREYIKQKDFTKMGQLAEKEAIEFHTILLTSSVPIVAWYPGTIEVMQEVSNLREAGVECYFTINTGFNVHILTLPENEQTVKERINKLPLVNKVLSAKVGDKPEQINTHLF